MLCIFTLKKPVYLCTSPYGDLNKYIPFNVRSTKGLLGFYRGCVLWCWYLSLFVCYVQMTWKDAEETYVFVIFHLHLTV